MSLAQDIDLWELLIKKKNIMMGENMMMMASMFIRIRASMIHLVTILIRMVMINMVVIMTKKVIMYQAMNMKINTMQDMTITQTWKVTIR